jgi:hypothetical protein
VGKPRVRFGLVSVRSLRSLLPRHRRGGGGRNTPESERTLFPILIVLLSYDLLILPSINTEKGEEITNSRSCLFPAIPSFCLSKKKSPSLYFLFASALVSVLSLHSVLPINTGKKRGRKLLIRAPVFSLRSVLTIPLLSRIAGNGLGRF